MHWHTLRTALLKCCLLVICLSGLTMLNATTAVADAPPVADYANVCSPDQATAINNVLGTTGNQNPDNAAIHPSSKNNHCLKFSVQGSPLAQFAQAKSGDIITLYGIGGWQAKSDVQIWLSDAFPISDTRHKWPLTNQTIGPDTDIHRECRTVIKGNQANPFQTYATPQPLTTTNQPTTGDLLAFDPVTIIAPAVTEPSIFNVRVSLPNAGCTSLLNAATETQASDGLLLVSPVHPTCVQQSGGSTCLSVGPSQVVYPGDTFTVTAQNLSSDSTLVISISDMQGTTCLPIGTLDVTKNFTTTLTAPPLAGLQLTNQTNGVYPFKIYATSDGTCSTAVEQPLYVAPPSISAPTELVAGDSGTIAGTAWLGGGANSAKSQALQIVAFVGAQHAFDCNKATELAYSGDSANGAFSLTYKAPNVSATSDMQVRIAGYPQGTSLSAACSAFDNPTCLAINTSSTCPLLAATTPLRIVPKPLASLDVIPILLGGALLLLLLPLFFWLGRRDEEEVVYTIEDVSAEREVINTTTPSQFQQATFARIIRETRSIVNVRTGKVKSQEVAEYDVFLDELGKEVRRLRPPLSTPPTSGTVPSVV